MPHSHQPKIFLGSKGHGICYGLQGLEISHLLKCSTSLLFRLLLAGDKLRVIVKSPDKVAKKLQQALSGHLRLLRQSIAQVPITSKPNELCSTMVKLFTKLVGLQSTAGIRETKHRSLRSSDSIKATLAICSNDAIDGLDHVVGAVEDIITNGCTMR